LNSQIVRWYHFEHLRDLGLHRLRVGRVNHWPGCHVVEVNIGPAIGGDQRNLEARLLGDHAFVAQATKGGVGLPSRSGIAEFTEVKALNAVLYAKGPMVFRGGTRPRFFVSDWLFFIADDGWGWTAGFYEVMVLGVRVCCKKHAPHLTRTDFSVGDRYDVVAELRSDCS